MTVRMGKLDFSSEVSKVQYTLDRRIPLLIASLTGNAIGEDAEYPTQSGNLSFSSSGCFINSNSTLYYDASSELDINEGTLEYFFIPAWSHTGLPSGDKVFFHVGNAEADRDKFGVVSWVGPSGIVYFSSFVHHHYGTDGDSTTGNLFQANTLNHFRATWKFNEEEDGSYFKVYINGELQLSSTGEYYFPESYDYTHVRIGNAESGLEGLSGYVRTLRISDVVQTDDQYHEASGAPTCWVDMVDGEDFYRIQSPGTFSETSGVVFSETEDASYITLNTTTGGTTLCSFANEVTLSGTAEVTHLVLSMRNMTAAQTQIVGGIGLYRDIKSASDGGRVYRPHQTGGLIARTIFTVAADDGDYHLITGALNTTLVLDANTRYYIFLDGFSCNTTRVATSAMGSTAGLSFREYIPGGGGSPRWGDNILAGFGSTSGSCAFYDLFLGCISSVSLPKEELAYALNLEDPADGEVQLLKIRAIDLAGNRHTAEFFNSSLYTPDIIAGAPITTRASSTGYSYDPVLGAYVYDTDVYEGSWYGPCENEVYRFKFIDSSGYFPDYTVEVNPTEYTNLDDDSYYSIGRGLDGSRRVGVFNRASESRALTWQRIPKTMKDSLVERATSGNSFVLIDHNGDILYGKLKVESCTEIIATVPSQYSLSLKFIGVGIASD